MVKAIWKGHVLAESDLTQEVDGRVYFPPDSVTEGILEKVDDQVVIGGWKGEGVCYHVTVGGDFYIKGAISFPNPKPSAYTFDGFITFGDEVQIQSD